MKNDNNFSKIYQITYLLEAPQTGFLIIEPIIINESEYVALKNQITTPKHLVAVSYGNTKKGGVAFRSLVSTSLLVNDMTDAMITLAYDLVQYGIHDVNVNPVPRKDLSKCLDKSKVLILDNKMKVPSNLSRYFKPDEIIRINPKDIKSDDIINNIINVNHHLLKETVNDYKLGIKATSTHEE